MVHALEEIRRILIPEGVMIDLRPLTGQNQVGISSELIRREIGWLTDLPGEQIDEDAANSALQEAAQLGWFVRESEQNFPFFYYWDTPEEMREYIKDEWSGFTELTDDLFFTVKSAWETAGANHRVRVRMKMLLTRWRKH